MESVLTAPMDVTFSLGLSRAPGTPSMPEEDREGREERRRPADPGMGDDGEGLVCPLPLRYPGGWWRDPIWARE